MAKRMVLVLSVTAVLLTALGFVKYRQVETAVHASSSFQPPPEAVTSIVAKRELWPATMSVIGTMEAVQGVTISADLPGTVARIAFESGQAVQKGDVMQGAMIEAWFAYNAATRAEMLPRIETPAPTAK